MTTLYNYEIITNEDGTLSVQYTTETEESNDWGENYYYTSDNATFRTLSEATLFIESFR